jgi:hypothetical protein
MSNGQWYFKVGSNTFVSMSRLTHDDYFRNKAEEISTFLPVLLSIEYGLQVMKRILLFATLSAQNNWKVKAAGCVLVNIIVLTSTESKHPHHKAFQPSVTAF